MSSAPLRSAQAFSPTPTPPATPAQAPTPTPIPAGTSPGDTSTPDQPPLATATLTQEGATGAITLRGDFSAFAPNTGEVSMLVKAQVSPDPGGFAAATASYDSEYISSAITWTR